VSAATPLLDRPLHDHPLHDRVVRSHLDRLTRPRPVTAADLDLLLALNEAEIPRVPSFDRSGLARTVARAVAPLTLGDPADRLDGFVLGMRAGCGHGGDNFAWFEARYDDFAYIERVVVAPHARRRGLAARFYDAAAAATPGAPRQVAEVNFEPRNDASLAFHHRLGFREVGRRATDHGTVVAMLVRAL
jgi:uncharacterized protein